MNAATTGLADHAEEHLHTTTQLPFCISKPLKYQYKLKSSQCTDRTLTRIMALGHAIRKTAN